MTSKSPDTDQVEFDTRTISVIFDGKVVPFLESFTYTPDFMDDGHTITLEIDPPGEWITDPGPYSGAVIVHEPCPTLPRMEALADHDVTFEITLGFPAETGRRRVRFVECEITSITPPPASAEPGELVTVEWTGDISTLES